VSAERAGLVGGEATSPPTPAGGGGDGRVNRARSAAVMAVGTTLSRVTGLARIAAIAYALGVAESRLADTYNIANTLPNVIYELVLGGVLSSVFIPVVVAELRTRPHDEAWDVVSRLVSTAAAVLLAVTAVAFVAAPWIISIFSSRLSGPEAAAQHDLATFMLRIFAPQIFLYGLAAIAGGLLNAHDRFAVPMFAPIVNNVVVIACFLAFGAVVSGTPTNESVGGSTGQKLLLALGTTAGVAAMTAVHWPFVRRLPGRLRARVDFRHPAVRKLATLSAWTLFYVVVNQIGFGVSLYLANGIQGGPTAYFTAFAFFQLPYGIVAVSIMTALVPALAARHVDSDDAGFRALTAEGLRTMGLLLMPATAAYLVLGPALIQALLERGVMGGASSALVADVLAMFAVGLLPFSAFLLFLRGFYALQDARTPAYLNLVGNVVTVVLDFVLFPHMGVPGLALAHSLGYVFGSVLAGVVLARRIGGLEARHTLAELGKTFVASAVAAAAMYGGAALARSAMAPGDVRALVELVTGGVVGLAGFLGTAKVLGVEDLAVFRRILVRR
jgi:putative peptidoglycan lipid II flippase